MIPALGRWRQKDQRFEVSLGYKKELQASLDYMRAYLKKTKIFTYFPALRL